MPEQYAEKCSEGCDFIIALQGHDFQTMEKGVDAYDECPNCGADLEQAYAYQPKFGFLKVVAGENR